MNRKNFVKRFTSVVLAAAMVFSSFSPAVAAAELSAVDIPQATEAVTEMTEAPMEATEAATEAVSEKKEETAAEGEMDTASQDTAEAVAETEAKKEAPAAETTKEDTGKAPASEAKVDIPVSTGMENLYLLLLPTGEDAEYTFPEERKDKDLSNEMFDVLVYEAGEEVSFSVSSELEYDLLNAASGDVFLAYADIENGKNVKFVMPQADLFLEFALEEKAAEMETAADTAADTALDTEPDVAEDTEAVETAETPIAETEEKAEAVDEMDAAYETEGETEAVETEAVETEAVETEDANVTEETEETKETEETPAMYTITLPVDEMVEYSVEESHVDQELSDEAVTVLQYMAMETVSFRFVSEKGFEIAMAGSGDVYRVSGEYPDGEVSFVMPEENLILSLTDPVVEEPGVYKVYIADEDGYKIHTENDVYEYCPGEEVTFIAEAYTGSKISSAAVTEVKEKVQEDGQEDGVANFFDMTLEDNGSELLLMSDETVGYDEEVNADENAKGIRTFSFVMPEADVILSCETQLTLSAFNGNVKSAAITYVGGNGSSDGKYPTKLTVNGGSYYTSLKKVTLTDSKGNKENVLCFCLQPSAHVPSGSGKPTSLPDSDNVAKGLFYLYNGPSFGLTLKDKSGKDVNFETILNQYCTTNGNKYALTHVVLSYLNGSDDWKGGCDAHGQPYNDVLSDYGESVVKSIAGKVKNMPAPNASLSAKTVSTYKENGAVRSQSVTYSSVKGNKATVSLPGGIVLVNETTNQRLTGTVQIDGGNSFHLECSNVTEDSTGTYTFTTTFPVDFDAYKLSRSGTQDVGFFYTTGSKSLELSVQWVKSDTPVKIKKESASPDITNGNPNYSMAGAAFILIRADGSVAASFVTDVNGDTAPAEVEPGVYTLRETSAPPGFIVMADMQITVNNTNELQVFTVRDEPIQPPVRVKKTSSAPTFTNNNNMYSLAGAEFALYDGNGNVVANYVTDGNGDTTEVQVPLGVYTLVETKVPKGYKKSADQTVVVDGSQPIVPVNVQDEPIVGDIDTLLLKNTEYVTDRPLEHAEFTVEYFDNESCAGNPVRTWVIETDEYGEVKLLNDCVLSGKLYANNKMPLGSLRIRETKAPYGYVISTEVKTVTILQNGENAYVTYNGANANEPFTNDEVVIEYPIFGGVRIKKIDKDSKDGATGDSTLESAVYEVVNADTVNLTRKEDTSIPYAPGEVMAEIVTDANGIAEIGPVLQGGDYLVREKLPSEGYLVEKGKTWNFTIEENDQIVDLTYDSHEEPPIRGGFRGEKQDLELGVPGETQGDAVLEDTVIELINRSLHDVYVDTDDNGVMEKYAPDELISVFTTDGKGRFESRDDYLPYGTYELKEIKPPTGYTPEGEDLSQIFSIRNDREIVEMVKAHKNRVIRFDIELIKFKDTLSNEEPGYDAVPLEDIEFEIYAGDVAGKTEGLTPILTIKSDEVGVATTADPAYPYGRLPYGLYTIHESKWPANVVPVDDFTLMGKIDRKTYKGIYKNDKPVEMPISVAKMDAESGLLVKRAKAEFQILDKDKNPVVFHNHYPNQETFTNFFTDESGTVTLPEKLPYGTYYLHEVNAPFGYVVTMEDIEFSVTERTDWNEPLLLVCKNTPVKGKMTITKTDYDTEEPVAGAVYTVYAAEDIYSGDNVLRHANGTSVCRITTGNDGKATTGDLYLGKYYVQETSSSQGYVINGRKIPFELEYQGQEVPIVYADTVQRDKPTRVKLKKVDIDGLELKGITFHVERVAELDPWGRNSSGKEITNGDFTTDRKGELDIKYLETGIYEIYEVKTLPGYVLDHTKRYVLVDKDGFIAECTEGGGILDGAKFSDTVSLHWVNDYTKWDFSKVDVNGDLEVTGAKMEIVDAQGKTVYKWTSDGTVHRINKIPLGDYTLVETQAPDGYVLATKIPFTVTNTGVVQKVAMVDKRVRINKYDETKETYVAGASLEIRTEDGKVVDQWVTDGSFHYANGLVAGKTYILVETAAPEGFALALPVRFTVDDDGRDQTVTMVNKKVIVSKVNTGVKQLAGAALEVRDANGNVVDSWTSDGTAHTIKGLVVGQTYTLVETKAPEGYAIALPITFKVLDNAKNELFNMVDKQVKVYKTDMAGEEIPGASLSVKDKETGKVVDSWVSDKKPHPISNLTVGRTYILREELVPAGYVTAEEIEFTVMDDREDQTVVMKDDVTKVLISKRDVASGEEVPGAKLIIKDEDGHVVAEWVSTNEPHYIEKLPIGKYTLTEITAPDGYEKAETIEFEVENKPEIQKHEMFDSPYREVEISKKDITDSEELPGAYLELKDSDGKLIEKWVSTEEPHKVKLPHGTYTLTERKPADGYVTAETITFEVLERKTFGDFEVKKVEMLDDVTKVQISKLDFTTCEEIPGAKLIIKDEDGNVVEEWVSTNEPHYIEKLPIGKYTLTEITAPDGYEVAETIEFEVTDTPEIQKHEMFDAPYREVEISKKDITDSKELPGAHLEIKDLDGNVVEEWISTEEPHKVKLPHGTYTLTERKPADGYTTAETITFVVEKRDSLGDTEIVKVEMFDAVTKVQISKLDFTTCEEIPGAKLVIKDKDGNVVEEWVSTTEPHYIEKLPIGKYTLTEITAPDGYEVAETIEFEVTDSPEIQKHEMFDAPYREVHISKRDITNSEEIPGAYLVLADVQGNVIEEWESEEEPHMVFLPHGTYTLTERKPADGYVTAETVTFEVAVRGQLGDMDIQTVEMFDDVTKVEISKQDMTTCEELPGAKLHITNEDGDVVEEWVSTNEPHYIEKLPIGTYVLTEITAPKGYEVAESVEFTVEDTGEIHKVVMYDKPLPSAPSTPAVQTGDDLDVKQIAVIGGIILLLLCAGVALIRKKKKED